MGLPGLPSDTGVFKAGASTAYKTFAFVFSLIALGGFLGWGAFALVGGAAEAKTERAAAPAPPAADWPAMKAAIDDLRRQASSTDAKLERLDDRLRDVQVDVGALKTEFGRSRR